MMICRGFLSYRRAVAANAGGAGIRGGRLHLSSPRPPSGAEKCQCTLRRERPPEKGRYPFPRTVAVAQLVEPLVVVQVVVGSSPISHPFVSLEGLRP